MANTKQAQKATRKTKKRTNYNKWWRTQIKIAYKSVLSAISGTETKKVTESVSTLQKKIDKSVKAGALHKNKAKRLKSNIMKKSSAKTSA